MRGSEEPRSFTASPKFDRWAGMEPDTLLEPSGVGRAARHLAELLDLITGATQRGSAMSRSTVLGARMGFAYGLIAAGTLLSVAGFIGIGLQKNALHSGAQI